MLNLKGIFVTGTDTGVGKTVLSAALGWTLQEAGKKVAVMKPIQTGIESGEVLDIEFVQMVLGSNHPLDLVCPYRFPAPLAPLVAARLAGEKIEIEKIKDAFYKLSSSHDLVLVEGAGGLLVPIICNYFMSDLVSDLGLPVIIVARPGLGTLNHTALTAGAARSRGLEVLGIVINGFPSNPGLSERTNPETMIQITGVPILGVLPYDPELSVGEGRVGRIRELAPASFSPQFGGNLSIDGFLAQLSKY